MKLGSCSPEPTWLGGRDRLKTLIGIETCWNIGGTLVALHGRDRLKTLIGIETAMQFTLISLRICRDRLKTLIGIETGDRDILVRLMTLSRSA